ncbi:MAG TPA: HEAT repeat domain-containing protein [Candidatus Cloacimonadota bacterium]|nr:HEAT repeat domain-containing protein [Candidatus Cloacimonadota bacterium]
MKKFILNYFLVPVFLFVIFNAIVIALLSWHRPGIKSEIIKNIDIAKVKYDGNAEDALILFLLDETNTPNQRSHVAIWTLGQIKSQKALSYLKEFYHNDPRGYSCKNKHDSVLCQRYLFNAINAIESDWEMHPEFNK